MGKPDAGVAEKHQTLGTAKTKKSFIHLCFYKMITEINLHLHDHGCALIRAIYLFKAPNRFIGSKRGSRFFF